MTTEVNNQKAIKNESDLDFDELVDGENEKIRNVIEMLEQHGWHPAIQNKVKLYLECASKSINIVNVNKAGERYGARNPYKYLHSELNRFLFQYQSVVNGVIRNYEYDFSTRKKLIIFLNPKCVYCGNEDIDLLDIDHKESLGFLDRSWAKRNNLSLFSFYWNNLIDAYMTLQILCIKCHKLKTRKEINQLQIELRIQEKGSEIKQQ